MTNQSEEIFNKIKEEGITPKPKWQFLLKNYFIWGVFVFSVVLGSVSLSVAIFFIKNNDWDVYRYLGGNFATQMFGDLPYLWIVFMFFFLGLAYYNARHTEQGYKYKAYSLILISILASFLGGTALAYQKIGHIIDGYVADRLPYYQGYDYKMSRVWNNPQKGLLGGRVVKIDGPYNVYVELNNKPWVVEINKDIVEASNISTGTQIKLIGKECGDVCFFADEIRYWSDEEPWGDDE